MCTIVFKSKSEKHFPSLNSLRCSMQTITIFKFKFKNALHARQKQMEES